jgi:hypothetical protein
VRVVRTGRGARIVEGDVVLSEILARPGATDTLFDVLAACVAALAPGPRAAILGFAGGGMIAPLRAMGFAGPVEAVDLSRAGEPLFRELSDAWAGDVRLAQQDAVGWLRRRRAPWDVIVEDLSIHRDGETIKPYAALDPLPRLIAQRLGARGVAVLNVLPLPGTLWPSLLAQITAPYAAATVIELDEYDNRIAVAGPALPPAREVARRVRGALRACGSNQAEMLAFRTLPRSRGV